MKQTIKKYLPNNLFLKLIKFRDDISYYKLLLASSNKVFTYFSLITSKEYFLEHQGFTKSALKYERSLRKKESNTYFIRRNIHRIEKGLTMRPLRKEFALRFILQTVKAFSSYVDYKKDTDGSELCWAISVLHSYFLNTESDDHRYKEAELLFNSVKQKINSEINNKAPELPLTYKNNITEDEKNSFFKVLNNRKSVRWFKKSQIELAKLNKALECASLAPSSCNRQPYRYVILNEPRQAARIASISAGTVGWFENVNCIAVLVADQSAFSNIANRHSIYVDSTLSVMPFILSLETQGLSTCIINWADIPQKEKNMGELLHLKENERVILSIAIGYAEDNILVPFSKRKYTNEIAEIVE
ncbi:MAG: nitroreductase family protein [Colwellia sp.]|nr:nitroreductase family protein [Colwellia sp.]MCW8864955.1 nitroreductase family protein [Colwellia sp.]MCW9082876.1 nitroreductase family protein [Colwellia sp.]